SLRAELRCFGRTRRARFGSKFRAINLLCALFWAIRFFVSANEKSACLLPGIAARNLSADNPHRRANRLPRNRCVLKPRLAFVRNSFRRLWSIEVRRRAQEPIELHPETPDLSNAGGDVFA